MDARYVRFKVIVRDWLPFFGGVSILIVTGRIGWVEIHWENQGRTWGYIGRIGAKLMSLLLSRGHHGLLDGHYRSVEVDWEFAGVIWDQCRIIGGQWSSIRLTGAKWGLLGLSRHEWLSLWLNKGQWCLVGSLEIIGGSVGLSWGHWGSVGGHWSSVWLRGANWVQWFSPEI